MIDDVPWMVLVMGGISSGKSAYAEEMIAKMHVDTKSDFYYFTPAGTPKDDEMKSKVKLHRLRRPQWLNTVECGLEVEKALDEVNDGSIILFDSIGTLVSRIMMDSAENSESDIEKIMDSIHSEVIKKKLKIIFVSEEVGMTLVALSDSGRAFQKILGKINQRLAALADEVFFITAGLSQKLK